MTLSNDLLILIKERGLLLEKDIFDLLSGFQDNGSAQAFLLSLEKVVGQKVITKSILHNNVEYLQQAVSQLPGETRSSVENVCVRLGLRIEIQRERALPTASNKPASHQIFYADTKTYKKLEVKDFTRHFRSRYQQIQRILLQRPELQNLIAINKISSNRQNVSIIAMVREKRTTKNKNIILCLEDLTGEINALIRADREELFAIGQELQLDDIVALKASGNREMLFIHELYFPDSFLPSKTKFSNDVSIAFLSDVHAGSDRHLGQNMQRFLDWIRSDDTTARKIKYIFFSGDNVDGVGIFPGQEHVLKLKSMREQYALLASYLRQIPSHITLFMCPGQHDAVRVAEPQPLIERTYAPELYEIENLVLVTNPALIKLREGDKEFKVLMYHGASIHSFINEIPELRLMKAHQTPAKAVRHMLKRRHLAPSHSSVVYIPHSERDPLVIDEVPDVLCTGEVHRPDIESYNGTLIITGSCWQSQTPFEEKVGNVPDPAKVPVLNLKTRELKILDFGMEETHANS
jgi:DNA polymerase II small subunit